MIGFLFLLLFTSENNTFYMILVKELEIELLINHHSILVLFSR